jgi:putative transposase
VLGLVDEAMAAGARQSRCCEVIGLDVRTLQRWRKSKTGEDERRGPATEPANKLSPQEREEMLKVANSPLCRNLCPKQFVPLLVDQNFYLASESSFYRVLREAQQMKHRAATRKPSRARPRELEATGPNQVWSWDITYLRSSVAGMFYYLYLIVDVWSRKVVGWEIAEEQSMEISAALIQRTCEAENVPRRTLALHADNGGPMKGATMLVALQRLGVMPSFSRPSCSNDNPYSESLFRTLKYRPEYPHRPFESLEQAEEWIEGFVAWYNGEHLHSGITYVTPAQRHEERDREILEHRRQVYEEARRRNPNRWSGKTRDWGRVERVRLNPEPEANQERVAA